MRRAAAEAAASQGQSNVPAVVQGPATADQSEPGLDEEFDVEEIEVD